MKRSAFLLTLVLALAACDSTGPDATVTGSYTLRTANGSNLPFVVQQILNDRVEITSGGLDLDGDHTFTATFGVRTVQSGTTSNTTETESGTWAQTGNQLSFTFPDGSVDTGVSSDDQITIVSNGVSFVYRK
jgi:hypothetical protein